MTRGYKRQCRNVTSLHCMTIFNSRDCVRRHHRYSMRLKNATSFFDSIDRLFLPHWLPTDQDLIHSRLRTTGITETLFEVKALRFCMVDVGGQRSERRKWIHSFEGVHCLLFIASLSGYNQNLLEDQNAVSGRSHFSLSLPNQE